MSEDNFVKRGENEVQVMGEKEKTTVNKVLKPGDMSESLFWLLIELSPFRSEKVISALRDFVVLGYTRREVCERYGVSHSYFSISLRRFLHIDDVAKHLINHYGFAVNQYT